ESEDQSMNKSWPHLNAATKLKALAWLRANVGNVAAKGQRDCFTMKTLRANKAHRFAVLRSFGRGAGRPQHVCAPAWQPNDQPGRGNQQNYEPIASLPFFLYHETTT